MTKTLSRLTSSRWWDKGELKQGENRQACVARLEVSKVPLLGKQMGKTMETVTDFISGGSKITAEGDCSHGIKRRLLLRSKAMTNLDSILKRKDITLLTKVRLVKAMVFPVVMYGCESWTIKKAEH